MFTIVFQRRWTSWWRPWSWASSSTQTLSSSSGSALRNTQGWQTQAQCGDNDNDGYDDKYIYICMLWCSDGWKMMIKSSISNLTCLIEQQMAWELWVNFQEERKKMFADKNNDAHNLLKYATPVTKIPPIAPLGRLACAIFGTDVRPIPITHNSSFPSLTVSRADLQVQIWLRKILTFIKLQVHNLGAFGWWRPQDFPQRLAV